MKNLIKSSDIIKPTKEELDKIICESIGEGSSLRLVFEKKETKYKFSNSFIKDSIIRALDLVTAISKLNFLDLDSVFILMRSELEVNVDLHWFYSIFLDNKTNGENLAKRFYQFGAKHYLEVSENYEDVFQLDPYLKAVEIKLNPSKDKSLANKQNLIDIVNSQSPKPLQRLQNMNWRALPGLISNKSEIEFKARAEKATEIAQKISNLKYAPYYRNWNILNAFTHWSSARMKYLDDEVAEAFYLRNLNVSLGFLHDMINVGYVYLSIDAPVKIKLLRKQFHYYST